MDLRIDAPGKNALSLASMEALLEGIARAKGEPLLVSGAGDAFSAGLNLKEVSSIDRAGMRRFLDTLDRLVEALYLYPAPTVAHVNGHAIAGGCVIALCCDESIAEDDPKIRIGLNETALGLPFPPKILAMVQRAVRPAALERVVLGAELFDPTEAARLGLVDMVAKDSRKLAEERLALLASHPREIYRHTKLALRHGTFDVGDAQRDFEERLEPAWTGEEVRGRIRARLARA
ncbi:enoyl-CoA hydratase/isomerase family protein [soil metagenome]